MNGEVAGGPAPAPSAKHRIGLKALLLAKSCKDLLAQKLPKKMSGGQPPHLQNSNEMRTCRFLLSLAGFCKNMSFPAQRC